MPGLRKTQCSTGRRRFQVPCAYETEGRLNITEGELNFFGNKYTINQGSVSFFNSAKIDPILNVDLETKARGVDVTLTLSRPINKLNLSYRSDPPVAVGERWRRCWLRAGRRRIPPGDSERRAVAEPAAIGSFGADRSGYCESGVGQSTEIFRGEQDQDRPAAGRDHVQPGGAVDARATSEPMLFTYISDVSSTSTQLIPVRWDFNPRWAAILTREREWVCGCGCSV